MTLSAHPDPFSLLLGSPVDPLVASKTVEPADQFSPFRVRSLRFNSVKAYLTSTKFKTTFKSTVAFLVASCLTLIPASARFFGLTSFYAVLAVILVDLAIPIGALIEMTFMNLLGVALGAGLSALAASTSSSSGVGLGAYIFVFTAAPSYLVARWPALFSSYCLCLFTLYFSIFRSWDVKRFDHHFLLLTMLNFACGIVITLLCGLLIFPHNASSDLNVEIGDTLANIKFVVDAFRAEDGIAEDDIVSIRKNLTSTRLNFSRLTKMARVTKLELFSSKTDADFEYMIKTLKNLVGHLSSMTSAMRINSLDSTPTTTAQDPIIELEHHRQAKHLDKAMSNLMKTISHVLGELALQFVHERKRGDTVAVAEAMRVEFEHLNLLQKKMVTGVFLHKLKSHPTLEQRFLMDHFYAFSLVEFTSELRKLESQSRALFSTSSAPLVFHFPSWHLIKYPFQPAHTDLPGDPFSLRSENEHLTRVGRNPHRPCIANGRRYAFSRRIWMFLTLFSTEEMKFAVKIAILTLLLSVIAFGARSKQFFYDWRMIWAITTIFTASAPTYAGEVINTFTRILGTLFGAAVATGTWLAFGRNPYVIAAVELVFGFLLFHVRSYPLEYIKISVVSLQTFITICLGIYTFEVNGKPVDVLQLAYQRTIMIILGLALVLLLGRFLWPSLASSQLRKGIANSFRQMSLLYTKIVRSFINRKILSQEDLEDIVTLEQNLQLSIIHHRVLLFLASREPRLQGPYPSRQMCEIIRNLQNMTDLLRSIRVALVHGQFLTFFDENLETLTQKRNESIKGQLIVLHILESTFAAKLPLPAYLPTASTQWLNQELLFGIKATYADLHESNQLRHVTFFAFISAITHLSKRMDALLTTVRELYGQVEGFTVDLPTYGYFEFSRSEEVVSWDDDLWIMNLKAA